MEVVSKTSLLNYPKKIEDNFEFRVNLVNDCLEDEGLLNDVYQYCKHNILFWIDLFCWTKDPRKKPDIIPFICYESYQEEYIKEIEKAIDGQYDCLTEKSRDMGVSWMVLYVFMHKWLFEDGSDFRVGSRKEEFVDKVGDIDTLFEKIRFNIGRQPIFLMPQDFRWDKHSSYMRILNPQNNNAIIGESANENFGSGGRRKAILLDEFSKWENRISDAAWTSCYSKDTEVLTNKGWRLIKDTCLKDKVYSINPITRKAEFMPVVKTYQQNRDTLIHFTGKSVDLLVTGNHKIVYETRTGKICFKEAESVMSMKSGSIPLVSRNNSRKYPKLIYGFNAGDWLEFLGWYISEGCTSKGGTIIITQSEKANLSNVERIKNLLFQIGLKYSYKGKDFNVNVRGMNKNARKELKSLGKCYEKYIPKRYFGLNKNLLMRLFQSLMLGDGSDRERINRTCNATSYTTSSKGLASDVQALAQLIGYKASMSERMPDRNKLIMGRPIKTDVRMRYNVYIGYKTKANLDKLNKRYIKYNDNVYCVETKYHTLYVRRNGIACWCGNTADVSKCRLPVSTPKGSGNKFALLAKGTKEKIKVLSLHWTLHPEKAKDVYFIDNDKQYSLNNPQEAYVAWRELQGKIAPIGLKGGLVRSPWYNNEALRSTDSDLAQEKDIDYHRSGYPFFDLLAISRQKKWKFTKRKLHSNEIPYEYYIRANLVTIEHKIEIREMDEGWLKIFELPESNGQYINGGDVSEGLVKGDESFGVIRNKYTRNVVATYNGLYKTDDFSIKSFQVCKLYNNAKNAIENNNHGHSVNQDLKAMDCDLYWTKREDKDGKITRIKIGWTTTTVTRPLMLDQLEEEIRENSFEMRNEDIISQAETFIKNEKTGKPEADGSFLDDGIIALAIAGQVIKEYPYKNKKDNNRRDINAANRKRSEVVVGTRF